MPVLQKNLFKSWYWQTLAETPARKTSIKQTG